MSAEGTRVRACVRRVVRLAEFESFELTEEIEIDADPEKGAVETLRQLREKVIKSVNDACDVVAAAHRPGAPVAPTMATAAVRLQGAPAQAPAPAVAPVAVHQKSSAYPPCANCGGDLQRKTGTSKKTGKPYDLVACSNRDCSYILPEVERKRYEAA